MSIFSETLKLWVSMIEVIKRLKEEKPNLFLLLLNLTCSVYLLQSIYAVLLQNQLCLDLRVFSFWSRGLKGRKDPSF